MTKYFLNKAIYLLLFVFIFLNSSQGQSNKPIDLKALQAGHPVITKTQGSNQFQSISSAIQDIYGNIWFGTTGEGVYKYDGKLFTQFTIKDGLSSNCVWSILEDKDGNIWFGTCDGICRTDGNKIISIPISSDIRPVSDSGYHNEWSKKSTVWSMLQDKNDKIWFGMGDGVYCYDGKNFSNFLMHDNPINYENLKLKLVSDMIQDRSGNIWFASGMPPGYEGFIRYDGKRIESFKPKNEGWFRNVVESKDGNLLLATRHYGVWTYDGNTFKDYSQPKDLFKESLNAILEDRSGNLWVGSDYGNIEGDTLGGLWYSTSSANNPTEKTFTKIFNKEVYFIFENKDNSIWFSTRGMGLYRYDRTTLTNFSE